MREGRESRLLHLILSNLSHGDPKLRLEETALVAPSFDAEPRSKNLHISFEILPSDGFSD